MAKNPKSLKIMVLVIVLAILIVVLISTNNKPSNSSKELPKIKDNEFTKLSNEYKENLRFESLPITYRIINENECGDHLPVRITNALDKLRYETEGVLSFKKLESFEGSANIDIKCSYIKDCYEKIRIDRVEQNSDLFRHSVCEHQLGKLEDINHDGNLIQKSKIEIIGYEGLRETGKDGIKDRKGPSGFGLGTCGYPNIELHEILRALGYDYNLDNINSILHPSNEKIGEVVIDEGSCYIEEKEIDKKVIDSLIETYG